MLSPLVRTIVTRGTTTLDIGHWKSERTLLIRPAMCAGPDGYIATYGLEPDMLTIGKPIASGIPAAAYGFTESRGA